MQVHDSLPRQMFVDTSAWYAIMDSRDHTAVPAQRFLRNLVEQRRELVTTTYIIAELHALLVSRANRHIARRALEELDRSADTTILRPDIEDEQRAREIITHYEDKDFSLTDAISFAVMERLGITHAFAFDHHFIQYGLIVLPVIDQS